MFADIPSVDKYVRDNLKAFSDNPPVNGHQRGMMSAFMLVAQHALLWPEDNPILVEARKVYNKSLR